MRYAEMDTYNSKLGDRYNLAVQDGDLEAQRFMLIDAAKYLESLPKNQPMYGDHQGGFCLACELLDCVESHIKSVEYKLIDRYHDECLCEYTGGSTNMNSYADEIRHEFDREMRIDCFGY